MTLKTGLLLLVALNGNADKAPKRGVIFESGGLVNDQYRLVFDIAGPFQIEETHHNLGAKGKVKWSRVLTVDEQIAAKTALDAAQKASERFPKNPAAESFESLTFIDLDQTRTVKAEGGFPRDSAAGKLVATLHRLREAVEPPAHQ